MTKFLLLLLIGIGLFLLLKGLTRLPRGREKPGRIEPPERMVACAHCGIHLPESESVTSGAKHYCSEEHRRLERR